MLYAANKLTEVKPELCGLEELLFETMVEIWRSRVPAAVEDGPYLLDPTQVMTMIVHLAKFFEATDKTLRAEACLMIIRVPTFLSLLANVLVKQIEGKELKNVHAFYKGVFIHTAAKATKKSSKQDVSCMMVVFHCLQMWINYCEEMKDHLGHSGIISNIVLIHLKLIQAFPAYDAVGED